MARTVTILGPRQGTTRRPQPTGRITPTLRMKTKQKWYVYILLPARIWSLQTEHSEDSRISWIEIRCPIYSVFIQINTCLQNNTLYEFEMNPRNEELQKKYFIFGYKSPDFVETLH